MTSSEEATRRTDAVAVAMAVLASASLAALPTLTGTVGPGFTITFTQGCPITRSRTARRAAIAARSTRLT